jgi:hypothetical protein
MSAVFESKTLGPTERLIMLALADHCDDAGRCYPSNARLCERTGLSERAVRTNIRALEEAGYLVVQLGVGQGGANVYHVRPAGGQEMPPAGNAPGRKCREGGQEMPPDGAAGAPKPSRTINEPSNKTREALCSVVSEETADAFIAHRKAKKAKLTEHAAILIAKKLRGHPDPDGVVERSIMNGWTGVFPSEDQPPAATFKPDFSKYGVS